MNKLQLSEPPSLGQTVESGGQPFVCVGVEPYTRRDGVASWVVTWASHCHTCGAAYETKSGLAKRSLTLRCADHAVKGGPITAEGRELRRAALKRGRATARANRKKAKALAKLFL